MKKVFVFSFVSFIGVLFAANNAYATSFDLAKEQVESGEALIFNPVSDGVLTKESSIEYVNLVEEKSADSTKDISEIMDQTCVDTADLETVPGEKTEDIPLITPRGVNIPNNYLAIDRQPDKYYMSSAFSGSGWRYSGYKFYFENSVANPLFGMKAYGDSFYFQTNAARHVVQANVATVYYPARKDGYGLWGYFTTYNPVNGCKYYIY